MQAKQSYACKLAHDAQAAWHQNDTRALWLCSKALSQPRGTFTAAVKDQQGHIQHHPQKIQQAWTEYWKSLLG
eukprot:9656651-Prorocentrum_lima.AAC.1